MWCSRNAERSSCRRASSSAFLILSVWVHCTTAIRSGCDRSKGRHGAFLPLTKHGTNKGAGVTWPTRRIQANHHPDTTTTVIRATVATIAGDGGIASRMDSDNLEWMHNEDDEIDDETGADDFYKSCLTTQFPKLSRRCVGRSLAGCSLHNLGSGQQVAAGARRRGGAARIRSAIKFSCSGGATMCEIEQAGLHRGEASRLHRPERSHSRPPTTAKFYSTPDARRAAAPPRPSGDLLPGAEVVQAVAGK